MWGGGLQGGALRLPRPGAHGPAVQINMLGVFPQSVTLRAPGGETGWFGQTRAHRAASESRQGGVDLTHDTGARGVT